MGSKGVRVSDDSLPNTAPPSWRGILLAVCVAQATAIVGFDFTLPFIPLYLQHDLGVHGLGQTAIWAGLIGFGPAIPATIFGPLWGRLADRFGYRAMLIRAMFCSSIMLTLMGLTPSPTILLVLRMVQGALTGTTFAAQALVAAAVPEKETARSMGLLQMSIFVGATFGPVGGGAVAQLLSYRASFVAAGILIALATLVVVRYVREPARRGVQRETEDKDRPSILTVLAIPAFAAALVLTLATQVAATSLLPVIPLYVQDLLHGGRNAASYTGWLLAASGVAAAIGSYAAGRLHRRVGLQPLLYTSIALSSLLLIPQALVETFLSFLLLRCAGAFAFGALLSLVSTWAATSSPRNAKGTAFGLIGAASSMGFGTGPLLGGALAAALGIRAVFVISGAMLGIMPIVAAGTPTLLPVAHRLRARLPRAAARRSPARER